MKILYTGVTTDNLRLRESAPSGTIITVIPKGQKINILRVEGDWLFVQHGLLMGYAHSAWIELTSDYTCLLAEFESRLTRLEAELVKQKEQLEINRRKIELLLGEIQPPDPVFTTLKSPGFDACNLNIMTQPDDEWVIKHVFTTHDGNWQVGKKKSPYSIVQWARDTYLKPAGHPRYFDDAGAQTHALVLVLDKDGSILENVQSLFFWPSGGAINSPAEMNKKSGWANYFIGRNIYYPDKGERGPFSITLSNKKAPILEGIGLPYANHVSTFVVFQRK